MENKYLKLRNNFFSYTLSLLVILLVIISYYRFMIKHDYVVSYNGECDPVTEKCFINCEDDTCSKIDNYSKMQKYEPDLYRECGADITDCKAASECFSADHNCSVTYCDKNTEGDNCSTLGVTDNNATTTKK